MVLQRGVISETAVLSIIALAISGGANAFIADFEDLSLPPESYWNGSDGSGGFTSGKANFTNNYNVDYGSWDGFAYSNITDTATVGMEGQYNAIPGLGQGGSPNYAIGYVGWEEPPALTLNAPKVVDGLYVTNDNYAYYAVLNGYMSSKKFGGENGDDQDWFKLTVTGKDAGDTATGTLDFYLADYRSDDNSQDYIVNTWEYFDLTALGTVKKLEFSLSSSDVGDWGMNTPAYFAIDTVVPEPATVLLLGMGSVIIARTRKR
ncbi:MAG: DUF4465 domain-containing protein [Phycisphaerales bacterium]|nr:MAG: DUF4465 domain-containing protein [Phycisphaerales bacterium]